MNRISLPAENHQQIKRFKRACAKHIGQFPSMNSWAHISFASSVFDDAVSANAFNFVAYYQVIENILSNVPAIELKITGFNYFHHGDDYRTIYAALHLDPVTLRWFSIFEKVFPSKRKLNPHITIAKKIPTAAFNTLWPHFQKLEFTNTFHVRNITILHKCSDETGPYRFYREISLRKGN